MFEKPKHNFGFAVEQVSRRLYGSPRAISRPKITSNVIKDIELADSSSLHGETFERLSDRDSTLCIYGNLEVRNEDGGIDCSPLHDEYRGREKGTTQFKSRSTQHMIYLSGKKGTLTVRGAGVRPEDAEFYICTHLLPRLRDAADNEEEDLEDLIDSD